MAARIEIMTATTRSSIMVNADSVLDDRFFMVASFD
jgi:hypothetical protein